MSNMKVSGIEGSAVILRCQTYGPVVEEQIAARRVPNWHVGAQVRASVIITAPAAVM